MVPLDYKQAQARSTNGNGLNKQPILENGLPALPDAGWDYDKTNRMAGIEKAIEQRKTGGSMIMFIYANKIHGFDGMMFVMGMIWFVNAQPRRFL
ncbi:MAG: hypothetical protein WCJ11_06095 [Methylococcaceae bacterium]